MQHLAINRTDDVLPPILKFLYFWFQDEIITVWRRWNMQRPQALDYDTTGEKLASTYVLLLLVKMSPLNGVNALNWVPIFTRSVRNMGLHAPLVPPTFTPAMRGGTHNYSKFTLIRSFRPFPWITPLTMCHDPFGATRIMAAPYIYYNA